MVERMRSGQLTEDTVEIPISSINQTPAKNTGPIGRVVDGENFVIEHYVATESGPVRSKTSQRTAFVSLSTDARDPESGEPIVMSWDNPEILANLGNQTVSVCDSVPRVYNGENAFIGYSDKRVVPSRFSQEVFHTTDKTIQVSDSSWIQNVTCSVWTETTTVSGVPKTVVYVGFKNDTGAWIIAPQVLYDPGLTVSDDVVMARTCIDGDGERFWVVHNSNEDHDPSIRKLVIKVYDLNGVLVAEDTIDQNAEDPGPGYWDISPRVVFGGIMIAQPGALPDGTTDVNVQLTTAELDGSSIDIFQAVDNTIHCTGPLGWISNDFDNLNYLATHVNNDGNFVYQVTELAQTHEFIVGGPEDDPDSFAGWVEFDTNPDALGPKVFLAWTMLAISTATVGPLHDPALRYTEVYDCDWANNGGKTRQINSVCLVSRAFKHDGKWYAITYYQSGSGLTVTGQTIDVTWTDGDYMIGPRTQPIAVSQGDLTKGSTQVIASPANIYISTAIGAQNIDGGGTPDSVVPFTASGVVGIPDGTQLLRWTFKNLTNVSVSGGGRLRVSAGCSEPSAIGDWEFIYAESAHVFVTESISVAGGNVVPASFATSGTVQMLSMTTYQLPGIEDVYSPSTVSFLDGGSVTVTGSSGVGTDGTFTIARAYAENRYDLGGQFARGIRVVTTTQVSGGSAGFVLSLTPIGPGTWTFLNPVFSDVMAEVPHRLLVQDSAFLINGNIRDNDGEHVITDVVAPGVVETDGDLFAQIFQAPVPKISVTIPLDVAEFTFKLQSVTLDYSLKNAGLSVQDAQNPSNNGLYKIKEINVADGLIYAEVADGRSGQFSESFPSDVIITILLANAVQPIFQPKWFMTPLEEDVKTSQVGRFEDGTAYADWRIEGDPNLPPNMFLMGISSVPARTLGKQFVLPYRAKSFTSGQPIVSPLDQVIPDAALTLFESTVGLKVFVLDNDPGIPTESTNELLLPGPLTSVFTQSGFTEQGINVSPEAPFVVSQGQVESGTSMTPGTTHQYVVVYRVTLQNGETVLSAPSKALDVGLTGDNNFNLIGGRLPNPLQPDGTPFSATFGLSNHASIGIIITRTSYRSDVPTIQHFEITEPLNVNGIAPISNLNSSGFAFPDDVTWTYRDANPDVNILSKENLYTDKGYLPRFPAAPSRSGCIWQGREWLVADDGSVRMSGEKTEGDAYWHFPLFRYTFGNDRAVNCKPMGNYLIVGCRRSFWYIPAPNSFPDASGRNGTLPNPVQITDITDGCTGLMYQIQGGVAYSSTAGGIWAVDSGFKSVELSRDIQDDLRLGEDEPTALAIDKFERLHVATNSPRWYVYDQIAKTWYKWTLPVSNAKLSTIVNGLVAWQDSHRIGINDPNSFADNIDEEITGISGFIEFANFSFGAIRKFRHVWAFQEIGEYLGPHRQKLTLSYPQDDEPNTVFGPALVEPPEAGKDYLVEFNPMREDASVFGLKIEWDFDDESIEEPGNSFALECLSAAVGLDYGQAQTLRRL
jgi:hypothetical protein